MLVVVLLSGLVLHRLVDLGDVGRGFWEVGPSTLKEKDIPVARRDLLNHECLRQRDNCLAFPDPSNFSLTQSPSQFHAICSASLT